VKILFTSTQHTSFITQDLNILRKHFDVDHLITRGLFAPLSIFSHLLRADLTFTWFASAYSFAVVVLARMMKKRSFLVIGGVDVARIPEMRYGIWLSPWKSLLVKYALRNATKVLAVDASLKQRAIDLARYPGENIECMPTGYDPAVWFPVGTKEPFVLTVAKCDDEWKMKIKGLDVLFECARVMPATRFVVIGLASRLLDDIKNQTPTNVEVKQFVEQADLLGYYQRAKVYCQPSYIEGFPNSVCEAMLCACVPVGTNVGGIPTAIADNGPLVPYGDIQQLAAGIKKALVEPASTGDRARSYILQNFALQKRETRLLQMIREGMH
jgi:glycosyltransferase involved in cell wall biosynthesis